MKPRFHILVEKELTKAQIKHPKIASLHEGYAIILEEMDEFKEEVWKKKENRDYKNLLTELVQIAAMVQRTAEDCGLVNEDNL